jgi:two-component sensor histidine kinase
MATDARGSPPASPGRFGLHFRDVDDRDLVEMNHRVANSLQLTAAYLVLQAKELPDASNARAALDAAAARVAATADLHRLIGTHVGASDIDLATYLRELCPRIGRSTGVDIFFSGEPANISFQAAQRITQIVTELAINAGKHADTGPGGLRVDCRSDGHDTVRLTLSDKGPGLPMSVAPGHAGGVGLAIVASVVDELDGQIEVRREGGTVFELTIPLH